MLHNIHSVISIWRVENTIYPTMAPSEAYILSSFLLSPGPLPTVISLQQFTELFPKRLRSHPHIKTLYRELQEIRDQDLNVVNGNIDQETKDGEKQKEELRKAIMKSGIVDMDDHDRREMDLDVQLFGQKTDIAFSSEEYHSMSSLLSEMELACTNIEHYISRIDQDAAAIMSELTTTVGDLSDLRYGKMQGPGSAGDVVDQAIQGLANLEDACYRAAR